jgi:curli biogenesis system outer membrane secretion channel CsgG
MWLHDGIVDFEIGRASTQSLDVDAPFGWVEVEGFESTILAEDLNLVNVLVSTIVSSSWVAFRVLIGHWGAKGIEYSPGGNIFGGDEEDGLALTLNFFFL